MLNQLLVHFLSDKRNIFIYPISLFCIAAATVYFIRLIAVHAPGSKTEYEYKGLALLTACAMIVWHPCLCLPKGWIFFVNATWIFSLFCALLQAKIVSGKPWKEFFSWMPQVLLKTVDGERYLFSTIHEKYLRRSKESKEKFLFLLGFSCFLLILVSLLTAAIYPRSIYGLLLMWWLVSFSVGLYQHLFAGKSFIKFWLLHALAVVLFLTLILGNTLSPRLETLPTVFWCVCIAFGFFWCSGAAIADHDTAKMAGRIVNTLTTLLLFAVNIFLRPNREMLDIINPSLLPVVAAGYLAALFADGIEYYRQRHTPQIAGDDDREEGQTEQKGN